jgi:hypothetical protein
MVSKNALYLLISSTLLYPLTGGDFRPRRAWSDGSTRPLTSAPSADKVPGPFGQRLSSVDYLVHLCALSKYANGNSSRAFPLRTLRVKLAVNGKIYGSRMISRSLTSATIKGDSSRGGRYDGQGGGAEGGGEVEETGALFRRELKSRAFWKFGLTGHRPFTQHDGSRSGSGLARTYAALVHTHRERERERETESRRHHGCPTRTHISTYAQTLARRLARAGGYARTRTRARTRTLEGGGPCLSPRTARVSQLAGESGQSRDASRKCICSIDDFPFSLSFSASGLIPFSNPWRIARQ